MKAICLRARSGPEAFAYEEVPQPRPGDGEVLVRVHAAGVIQTELSWVPTWTTRAGEPRPLPVIPGHEFSGEISALRAEFRGVDVGDRSALYLRRLERGTFAARWRWRRRGRDHPQPAHALRRRKAPSVFVHSTPGDTTDRPALATRKRH